MGELLIRLRFITLLAVAVAMVGLALLGRHVQYEQSIQSFFEADDPAVVAYRRALELFGNDQFVFLCYDDPELISPAGMARVAELAAAIAPSRIEGVVGVESLDTMPQLWRVDEGLLALEQIDARIDQAGNTLIGRGLKAGRDRAWAALKSSISRFDASTSGLTIRAAVDSASSPEERTALRERIAAHPLFQGTVIDSTGRSTAVVARLKSAEDHDVKVTVARLREEADAFANRHGLGTPAVVGPPVLLADGFVAIEKDGRRLSVVGMALIGLVMLTATRSLWWAFVPMLAGWTVWLSTETILSVLDIRLSLSGGPLVAQIIVLTMPAASHLALHFRDALRERADRRLAASTTIANVSKPIAYCALAGAMGYGALLTSNVVPVRQFGSVLAVCTAAAALLTLALSPSAMLPPTQIGRVRERPSPRPGGLTRPLISLCLSRPLPIVLTTFAVFFPLAIGLRWIEFESNYINAFKPSARVVRDYFAVEDKLGGIGLVSLVVPTGEAIESKTLAKLRSLDEAVSALEVTPEGPRAVSRVLSIATVLDPEGALAGLPERSRDRILANKLELIAVSPQAGLLRSFWNAEARTARVLVRLKESQQARDKARTFDRVLAMGREAFGPQVDLTGLSHLLTLTTRGVIATQWTTFAWSTASILLVLLVAFRSLRLAALAILPTLLSVGMVLGLMGWLGVKLDLATALVGSVALGLSVDDTFHCLFQFRRGAGEIPFEERLVSSYSVTGPGVLLSSLAVAAGFAVLRFSEFVPFSNFGAMVGIATLGSSLGNLLLLPACLCFGNAWQRRKRSPIADQPVAAGPPVASS